MTNEWGEHGTLPISALGLAMCIIGTACAAPHKFLNAQECVVVRARHLPLLTIYRRGGDKWVWMFRE